MPICSYVVVPAPGAAESVTYRLTALAGCQVTRADNRDLLLLVTDTPDVTGERALRDQISEIPGILALLLTFGEIDPEVAGGATAGPGQYAKVPSRPAAGGRSNAETGTPSALHDR